MLKLKKESNIEEIIKDAEEQLRTKQPSSDFLSKYDFIKVSFDVKNDDIVLLSTKSRILSVELKDIFKIPSFLNDLKNAKTKAELKKEKKALKISESLNKLRNNLDTKLMEKVSPFGTSQILTEENKNFLFDAIKQRIIAFQELRLYTLSIKDIEVEINKLLDGLSFDQLNIGEWSKNTNLSKIEFLNKNPEMLLNTDFPENLIIAKRETNEDFKKSFKYKFKINNSLVSANITFKYGSRFLDLSSKEKLMGLKPLDVSSIKNLEINEKEIDQYISKIFNRITEDISLIEKDLLLKKSIFEDFKSKITNVKKNRVKVVFNIDKPNQDLSKLKERIISSILGNALEVKERRLMGFKRSFSRKIIQNNIEIEDFKALFPKARSRDRELLYIQGETNSGKTYTAFEIAKDYTSGVYAAPLRLLALEGQQEFEKRGIECSMITGEERDERVGSTFVSSTVEMMDYSKEYDVAIIDEVQLLNDPDRGHAWLEAIIGVNAKKVIMVGSKDIESIIMEIAEYLQEPLEIKKFERKTRLEFDKDLFKRLIDKDGKLPPHSAVIAFSKKDVLDLKSEFEKRGNKVSVIYGALPPQVRRSETERFVKGETDVVIATDAIGMGLNLPIEYLFFSKKEKYNGKEIAPVEAALVKQIVGRSGRYKKFEIGYVSALSGSVFDYVLKEFSKDTTILEKELKCSPNYAIINQVQELTGENSIYKLLQSYNNSIKFDFDIKNHMNEYAYMISRFIDESIEKRIDHLSLNEKVKLVNAPISMDRSFKVMGFYKQCIYNILDLRDDLDIHPISLVHKRLSSLNTDTQAKTELSIKMLDLLSWLSFNFDEFSCLKDEIDLKRKELNKALICYLRENK